MGLNIIQFKQNIIMKLLAAALMISAVAGFHINSEEELVKKFGRNNIKFDQGKTKSEFCNQCMQITVSSTGGTLSPSGSPPTTSTSPPTPTPTPSCTTSSGWC